MPRHITELSLLAWPWGPLLQQLGSRELAPDMRLLVEGTLRPTEGLPSSHCHLLYFCLQRCCPEGRLGSQQSRTAHALSVDNQQTVCFDPSCVCRRKAGTKCEATAEGAPRDMAASLCQELGHTSSVAVLEHLFPLTEWLGPVCAHCCVMEMSAPGQHTILNINMQATPSCAN